MLVFINIGTNLGDRRRNLSRAVVAVAARFGTFEVSHAMESEPMGFDSANKFLNIAMVFRSEESPLEILHALQEIEHDLGDRLAREHAARFIPAADSTSPIRDTHRDESGAYKDRFLDIDIMTIEGVEMQTEELTLPHPRLRERPFFMEPLKELLDQIPQ